MAHILNGNLLAQRIREKLKMRLEPLPTNPGLAVILVGDDPASHTYVRIKQKACEEVGVRFEKFLYPEDVSTEELIEKVEELNKQEDVSGILVQLPLPNQDPDPIIAAIDCNKDVDGFHPENLRRLKKDRPAIAPAVALGVMKLIDATEEDLQKKSAAIVGSDLFAEPLHVLMRERGIEPVTVTNPSDPDFEHHTKSADVLVVAMGIPGLIKGEMIKPGAIVIDVGTTKVEGKLKGDVDFESTEPIAGYISPVPGGVGPMTVAMLLVNILKAVQLDRIHGKKEKTA